MELNIWNENHIDFNADAVFRDVPFFSEIIHISGVYDASQYVGAGYAGRLSKGKKHTTVIEATCKHPRSSRNIQFKSMDIKLLDASGANTGNWFLGGVVPADFTIAVAYRSTIWSPIEAVLMPDGYYQYSRIDELKVTDTIIDGATRKTVQSIEVGKSHPDSWIRLHTLTYTDGSQDEKWGHETVIVRRDYPEGLNYAQQS